MADIYENLENFNEIATYRELALENEALKIRLDDTTAELKQIKMDFDKLAADHQQLLVNYSSLLKTARAEVERKADLMINASSKNDYMFLRMLFDKGNFGKRRGRRLSKKEDFKSLRPKKKSGSADICEEKLKARSLKDDKDQLLERKDPSLQLKSKTEYRIPKLTKPKDEPVVPKKETKSELQKERKYKDDCHEKENKQTVKAGSIFSRRKSMPVVRHEPLTFSSDEETQSTSTLTARSYSTRDDTNTASDRYKRGKSIEPSRKKSSEPPSSHLRHSGHREALDSSHTDQRESTNIEYRHADHRYSDYRYKIAKNFNNRDMKRSKERCPSREDPYRRKDFREREEAHRHNDRYRPFEAPAHHLDNRLSRRDVHDRRQNERGRQRVLESPQTDKYVRGKSRDRRSHYQQSDRAQIEHEPLRSRQNVQSTTQKSQDRTPADRRPGSQQGDKLLKQKCSKDQPVKSKIRDEDEEPAMKRRRVESLNLKEDSGRNEKVEPMELATLQPQTCRSPDELLVENVHVETPVKEIATTVATGQEDPRLTSTRYMKIVEENNRIRLSTVTSRNVDLVVLPPYSKDIFQSQDPNNKFEEYTEEDLVKDIYIDFDDRDNHSMESGEIDDSCIYSDLIGYPPPTEDFQEKQQTSKIVPPLLLSIPPDTPQMSKFELLQSVSVESRQTTNTEVLQNSITSKEEELSEKANKDEPSYSEAMAKKFRISRKKSTENTLENSQMKGLKTLNVTSAPKIPLESILSDITRKSGVQTTEDSTEAKSSSTLIKTMDCAIEKPKTDLDTRSSSVDETVSESKFGRSSLGIKDKHPTEDETKNLKTLNVTSPTKNPLEFILSNITRKSGVQTTTDHTEAKSYSISIEIMDHATEKSATDLTTRSLSIEDAVLETKSKKSSFGSKDKHLREDPKLSKEIRTSESSAVVNKGETKEKALTKRQIVEDDLELSDDDNSANADFHHITAKEKDISTEETKQFETKKQKARSKARKERTSDKKTSERDVDKVKPIRSNFTELFGESSSLITPEDLEMYTHPNVQLQSEIDPSIDEEAAVHIDVSEKATVTNSGEKHTESKKMRTRSSNKTKSDDSVSRKSIKRVSEATDKQKVDTKTASPDEMEEVPSEVVPEVIRINPAVEAEPKFVKTVIISTGAQPVVGELPKHTNESTQASDDDSSRQSVPVDSVSQSKEVDAPDVRVILKRRRKRVLKCSFERTDSMIN